MQELWEGRGLGWGAFSIWDTKKSSNTGTEHAVAQHVIHKDMVKTSLIFVGKAWT
jgi:hypothetical protein